MIEWFLEKQTIHGQLIFHTSTLFSLGLLKRQCLCFKFTNTSGFKDSNHKIHQSNPRGHVRELLETLDSGWINVWTDVGTYWTHLVNVKAHTNWHEVMQSQKLTLFWPKYAQKLILVSEFQKSKCGFGISTSKIPCVAVFRQNRQLWIFSPKFWEITLLHVIFWF